ncbi:hypothetical protein BWI17_22415 [Betaproteobacteria bacterium GR16-43]|nr:hypothetical protein BWI17_22415 [Betaproteobacteria bacterium GR16-43]
MVETNVGSIRQSFKYSEALAANLRPSRLAVCLVAMASISTAIILVALPMPSALKGLLAMAVAALAADALRVVALRRGARGVVALRVDRAGAIEVRDASGRCRIGTAQPGAFVAPWLTIVRWRPHGGRFDRTFIVLPDMIDGERFRRLRVLLQWGSTE